MRESWNETRKAYEAYRQTKRNCRNVWMEHERSYRQLDRAFTRLLNAQASLFKKIDDPSQPEKLQKAAKHYQQIKASHDTLVNALTDSIKVFQDAEIAYTKVILNNARKSGMKISDIAEMFGIWNSRISAWLGSKKNMDLVELYNREFGELDPEEDPKKEGK